MVVVDAYCVAYNEEKIIPYFVDHYRSFCRRITIFDNFSTDNTTNISLSKSDRVKVVKWGDDKIDEREYLKIKQGCREYSLDADFIIVVDADEFLTIPDGYLERCKLNGITLPKVKGIEMSFNGFDFTSDINVITKGRVSAPMSKRCIFNPNIKMGWDVGCHPSPSGDAIIKSLEGVKEDDTPAITLKHYKWINLDYVLHRHKTYHSRLSEFNLSHGLGSHYSVPDSQIVSTFNTLLNESIEV